MNPMNKNPAPIAAVATVIIRLSDAPVTKKVEEMNRQKIPLPLVDFTSRKFSLISFTSNRDRKRIPPNIL